MSKSTPSFSQTFASKVSCNLYFHLYHFNDTFSLISILRETEYSFSQYLPSELAAALILASRTALQLEPRWRPELSRLTLCDEEQIHHIFQHVWSYYEEQFPGHGMRAISPRSVVAPM